MNLEKLTAKDIMRKDVVTIDANEIVGAARLKMLRQGIGGLPVLKWGKLVGMITFRDIELAGKEVIGLKVKDLMSKNVVSIKPETTLKEMVKIVREKGYQRLPVVKKGKVVGIVTQSCLIDVLKELLK
ncbi:MAG: CBS domain-containing protein [Candidatus Aenigmarchaeota archaeon]|nr:CBS domain-containing protein [Candidatus Aenigmarchaeota archaeon]